MALLHRFTQLNDRYNTGIFTFIVTKSVIRDPHRDATTKDFIYGYHRWALTFTRANEKALGVFLILRNPCANSKCYSDYSFTLLNKEHYSKNEIISDKQVLFTTEKPAQGVSKWILLTDIASRKFSDESGEFLLELSLSNILTIFELDLTISSPQILQRNFKQETNSIQFGGFDWNLCIRPQDSDINNEEFINFSEQTTVNVFLNRLTSHDRLVRVKYRLFLANKRKEDSGILDQISYDDGRIVGTQVNLFNLIEIAKANKNTIRFYFEMYLANLISESKVNIVREQQPVTNCYDRNKQGWSIEADLANKYLQLKLFFVDLESVPKNHLRFISFNLYVITKNARNDSRESIGVLNGPHSNYYITDHIDVGVSMDTDIESASILKVSPKDYLENDTYLTVHIEWIDSIMLFNHLYHKYDDLARIHCAQMRREITALINENTTMERQLFSYQKSISGVSMERRGTPQPINLGYGGGGMQSITGHQSSIGNSSQHRVSDPYILDNLMAPFNSLINNKAVSHQIVSSSSNHPSPSHNSKTSHQHPTSSSNLAQQQQQIKTGQHQTIHQSSTPHQTQTHSQQQQQQQQQQQAHQQTQFHHTAQQQANTSHLNKTATTLQQTPPNQPQQQPQQQIHQTIQQTPQSQSTVQQMGSLNSSIANINLQNSYGLPQSNNSPTLTSMQHYQLQQQQMNLNQMSQLNQWPQQQQQPPSQSAQNMNPLIQHHLSSANRSTSHLPAGMQTMNPVTTTINPILNYNVPNQLVNTPLNTSNLTMTNEAINQANNQLNIGGQPLTRHLSSSTCNLNQSAYATNSNLANTSNVAGMQSANQMNSLNKPISSSNHNLNSINQSSGLMQYTQNGQQRFAAQQPSLHHQVTNQQLPNHHFRQQLHQQPPIYQDQRTIYLQQMNSVQKSPLYTNNNDLNYS